MFIFSKIPITVLVLFGFFIVGVTVGGFDSKPIYAQHGDEHGDHDDDEHGDDHDEHSEEGSLHLEPARLATLEIGTATVRRGTVSTVLSFPSVVQFDPDQVAHLSPRISGVVREVLVGIGDTITKGQLLAVLDSRELAQAKSHYMTSLAMLELAQSNYSREERLFADKISAEMDYLEARQEKSESEIAVRAARQQLLALGLSAQDIKRILSDEDASLTRYEIRAPFAATVIRRHITVGETVDPENQLYFIAQLNSVWVMGRASERDIRKLKSGQRASIKLNSFPGTEIEGYVDYIGSFLDEKSRTMDIRVTLPNPDHALRAGMFGRMSIFLESDGSAPDSLVVPAGAVQRTAGGRVVFVIKGEGEFQVVEVDVLRESNDFIEVLGPLKEGDLVATGDTFTLKSEADKEEMGGGHSH